MTPQSAAFTSGAIIAAAGVPWLYLMYSSRIPKSRALFIAANAAAALLGAYALCSGVSFGAGVVAAVATLLGAAFVVLCAFSRQASTPAAVRVGERVLEFTATDDEGRPFDLASLRGRPFMLKFFRGHWCPYCVAELRRWNEMIPDLDARGIRIVTVCTDTPEKIRSGRTRHGLPAVMLSDPELRITDLYRLRNPKSFAPKPGVIVPLPIPTTVLVGADGIVRWIDQAEDYMQRSDPGRVMAAVAAAIAVRSGSALRTDISRSPLSAVPEARAFPG